ncbi:MAG TPA: hypothetical protein VHC95_10970 [Opitutales bacterium]|nr:hypothetical protein [Opitutales bacterium]
MTAPTQPPPRPPARREFRPWTDFDQLIAARPEDRRTMGSALLLALLFHGMLFAWVLPWLDKAVIQSPAAANGPATVAPPPVEYDLTPVTKEDLQSLRFVEANPNAPVAKPVQTNNISNRDQRVAQPVPNPDGQSDRPAVNGTLENSPKIIQGASRAPTPPAPPPSPQPVEQTPTPAAPPPTAPPPAQVASAPRALEGEKSTTTGEGVPLFEKPGDDLTKKPNDLPPSVQAQQEERPLPPGPLTPEIVAQRAAAVTPSTRPNAPAQTHAGPILKNIQGTHLGGLDYAQDAKLTPFGEYLSLMYEAIAADWYAHCDQFNFSPRDWGTQVEVAFVLNAQGEVEDARVERSTASRGATLLGLNAVKSPAPYAKWTPDMRAMLGERYTMHVTFFYE